MTVITLFKDVIVDTNWNYQTVLNNLKDQGCNVTITGGTWLIAGIYKNRWLWIEVSDFNYTLDFDAREYNAKLKSITKIWRTGYEEKHGIKDSEVIWKA